MFTSSLEVIITYPSWSPIEVFRGFFSGKNFFKMRVIMRAFSKFCRLIVSIDFPPLGPPDTYVLTPTTARRGSSRGGVC